MITSKLPNVGITIFTQMSQLAAQTGAINLSQGFPDFDGPQSLRDAVGRHIASGHNQYSPMTGLPALRQQIAAKIARSYGANVDADTEVTVTPGATQAIFCAIQAVIHSGDEVIVFDPAYDSYEPSVELAGGRCVHVQLGLNDFSIDFDKLSAALSPRTRMIILNTPHNPSGALISRAELDQLAALIRDRDIYVISDEVYEHLVFDGVPHVSVLAHEELYQRAFVVSSFGKTYHVTGWKTGYVVAPPALTAELRKVHQYVSFCGVTPLQYALADYMAEHPEHVEELPGFYQAKRDLFCDLLETSRFSFTRVTGTYFQLVDYSQIRPDLNDVEMAMWMTREHGVASIPVSVFYQSPPEGQRLVRLCFAKREETLREAAAKLCVIWSALPDLNLALIQTSLAWHDRQANLEHFDALLEQARGADLIILPEMFTTGFSMESETLAEAENGPTSKWLRAQAAKLNAVVTGSVIIQAADGSHRNRLLWARPDGEVLHYDKRHLFRMAGEHNHYTPGERQVQFELKGWRVRPLICYDLRFPVWSRDAQDTDLLLYTANWPGARRQHWNRLLPARAIENLCYVAAVNRVGTDGKGFAYTGDSQVLDFQGETLLAAGEADGVFKVVLEAASLAAYRERFPANLDADTFEFT